MKVLILEGSPRIKGNSSILCDEFEKGAIESGCEVEKIHITRKKVGGCLGCDACQKNGGTCIQKDDMAEIKDKMINADAIVLASPIYFYSMSSQLKALIDRTYAFYTKLESKTFYFIITCAAPDESYTKTMIDALHGFTCCVPNSIEGGTVIGTNSSSAGDVKQSKAMLDAYNMGKSIVNQ